MKKTVKVVFKEDVEKHLKGDEIEVASGYARNYLFPKKLAVKFDDLEAKKIVKKLKQERETRQKEIDKLKKLAENYQSKKIIIKAKAGKSGKLFGSVVAVDVAKKLKIEKSKVKMKPIKEIGEHYVELDLGNNIKIKVKIKVEANKVVKK